jgi:phospholipase C
VVAGLVGGILAASAVTTTTPARASGATTPIKHLVVIFDENVSFDHYFATYPNATNSDGVPFYARVPFMRQPVMNRGARTLQHDQLLAPHNPNAAQPARLSPKQAVTCDQDHGYAAEQLADNGGLANLYVQKTQGKNCPPGMVMNYYDGNTVTALWNYAQQYAMSDNYYGSTFGPSTPGALNLISGQTWGVTSVDATTGVKTAAADPAVVQDPDASGVGTVINDPDPAYDDCSGNNHTSSGRLASMSGKNVGDLLNSKGVSWGWFQGGFTSNTAWNGLTGNYAQCSTAHANIAGGVSRDYSAHHNPFQYYQSTGNPHHLAPTGTIGQTDQANHQYDLTHFDAALKAGVLPEVSFLKPASYQDGHAGYSDPIDEQNFLIREINQIQSSPAWADTAIVVTYDDSDGWYDHMPAPISNGSQGAADSAHCQSKVALGGRQDRCGPGPRLPLLVISPWAKPNFIDRVPSEQASILSFIEQNWGLGTIGGDSFDQRAIGGPSGKPLGNLFDFSRRSSPKVLLAPNGSYLSGGDRRPPVKWRPLGSR